jgi:hypothetical protein
MASVLISTVSLLLSMAVAWLTLFRRGRLGMTQPLLVGFLSENGQPKLFKAHRAMGIPLAGAACPNAVYNGCSTCPDGVGRVCLCCWPRHS